MELKQKLSYAVLALFSECSPFSTSHLENSLVDPDIVCSSTRNPRCASTYI
ncbi:hypothetical protein Plhal304r1_c024g0081481 [Plasmopara halstedii]